MPADQKLSNLVSAPPSAARVMARCDALAECSDHPEALTRLYLGPGMKQAHARVAEGMHAAGLAGRTDAAGNLVGRRAASNAAPESSDTPVLLLGSHLDTVPDAGRYDGALGVIAALEAVEQLGDERLPFHLDVIGFSEEEGVRYAMPYLGSRAIAGTFDPGWLDRSDERDITMRDAVGGFGLDAQGCAACHYRGHHVLGFIELHLEQGPVLEQAGRPVGIVSAIAGQTRLRLTYTGRPGHAGTTPMDQRADALVAASRLITRVHELGRSTPGLRATVGWLDNTPNIANVIPGHTRLSLDLRHADDAAREAALRGLIDAAEQIAGDTHTALHVDEQTGEPAVAVDPTLTDALGRAVHRRGIEPMHLLSGAGHDAVAISALCGIAMLFIRHPGGVSHHPDERVDEADVGVAVDVLTDALHRLGERITPHGQAGST